MTDLLTRNQIGRLLPGIILAVVIALLAGRLSVFLGETLLGFDKSPVSSVMVALLIGMFLTNIWHLPRIFDSGVGWSTKHLLRTGIVLLGLRLSIAEVARVGAVAVPLVVICVLGALLIVRILGRLLRVDPSLSTLIAVGTSICGVSAILATGPTIGAKDEEIGYAVTTITIFGILGLLLYPFLAAFLFSGQPQAAGLFLGTAIHDTSQVTGAALLYSQVFDSPDVLDVALITKLARNLMMALIIPFMAFRFAINNRSEHEKRAPSVGIPLFVIGFVLMSVLRSVGDATSVQSAVVFGTISPEAWANAITYASRVSVFLLVAALAGIGLRTRIDRLLHLGIRPFIMGFSAALVVGVLSFVLIITVSSFL